MGDHENPAYGRAPAAGTATDAGGSGNTNACAAHVRGLAPSMSGERVRSGFTGEKWLRLGPSVGAAAIGLALATTVTLGALLRWQLAGTLVLPGRFADLRHAHSHLGAYAVLIPLAWLAWSRSGARAPGLRQSVLYAIATALAFVGFLYAGYGIAAIAGSTVVAALWLSSAWSLRQRMADASDPLGSVLPGVVAAEACIPPIALLLRREPDLARAFVTAFLTVLLLAVVAPSALSALRVRLSWLALFAGAVLGAAALSVWPEPFARAGLVGYSLLAGAGVYRARPPIHLVTVWLAFSAGLIFLAIGLLPNAHPVVIGAIHFLVLSPILGSLAPAWLQQQPSDAAWWIYHGAVALLAGPLVAQGVGAGPWTAIASAVGGTLVLLWWGTVLFRQRHGVNRPRDFHANSRDLASAGAGR